MKVKIFTKQSGRKEAVELEEEINKWLAENDQINITDKIQSINKYRVVISIWYECKKGGI